MNPTDKPKSLDDFPDSPELRQFKAELVCKEISGSLCNFSKRLPKLEIKETLPTRKVYGESLSNIIPMR